MCVFVALFCVSFLVAAVTLIQPRWRVLEREWPI